MSWDAYVTNNLMCVVDKDGNTLTSAALVGQDTTPDASPVWAQSPDSPPHPSEAVSDQSVRELGGRWCAGWAQERSGGRSSAAAMSSGV